MENQYKAMQREGVKMIGGATLAAVVIVGTLSQCAESETVAEPISRSVREQCAAIAPTEVKVLEMIGVRDGDCDRIEGASARIHCIGLANSVRNDMFSACMTGKTGVPYNCKQRNVGVFDCEVDKGLDE